MSSTKLEVPNKGHIYFFVFSFSDFSCDYLRFFDENKDIFRQYNIEYGLLDVLYADTHWQNYLWSALFTIRSHKRDGSYAKDIAYSKKYMESALRQWDDLDREHCDLLFCLPASYFFAIPTLLNYLHEKKRFPYLHKSTPRLLWLFNDRDKEVEGVYRWHYPQASVESLLSNVKIHRDNWCQACREVMDLLGPDSAHILWESGPDHPSVEEIFTALHWSVPANACKPLRDARVYSRELFVFCKTVVQKFNLPYADVASILRVIEADPAYIRDARPFLTPDALREIHKTHRQPLQDIVWRYASKAKLLRPHAWPGGPWQPYDRLSEERYTELLRLLFTQQPRLALRCLPFVHSFTPTECKCIRQALTPTCITLSDRVPKLSVLTLTRNHAPFLADCIESVLAQQTRFPVQHIIVDDVSSDGTQEILYNYAAKYDSIIPLFMPSDRPSGENVRALFRACHSPFVALCDGDDYFTDPQKLQKQVDFLEAHPTCAICFHPVQVVYEDGTDRSRIYPQPELLPRGKRSFYYLADLFKCNFMQTNSVMYRWRFCEGLPEWFEGDLVPGDWYWHLLHAQMGKIGFMQDVMSVYRRHKQALFYAAETENSSIEHRLQYGMAELHFYDAINKHFKRRYERSIISFSNNVLTDLLEHYLKTKDDSLFKKAEELYPDFVIHFLNNVKIVKGETPRQGT